MKIAFYAPLKPPDHPVPSGDRQMARMLIAALERAGHEVSVVSTLRAYLPDPGDHRAFRLLEIAAMDESARIARQWRDQGPPEIWFCYHPYHKSPDLLGPALARRFGLPWISVEASLSRRSDQGVWALTRQLVAAAVAGAAANFSMTARDRAGLLSMLPAARVRDLPPFLALDTLADPATLAGNRLVCVAMMRPGDKMASYRALAAALRLVPPETDWQLAVCGDGVMRDEVQALFPADRVIWAGALAPDRVAEWLALGSIYVWPGCGEAYGLAYLEAQAVGLPVVAWATAGVPEVVADGRTGLLVPKGDVAGLASAIARLLADPALRRRLGRAARQRVLARHGLDAAAERLDAGLRDAVAGG